MSRFFLLLLAFLFLTPTSGHAATLLLCPGTPLASPGALTEDYTDPNGVQMRAIVTEAQGKPLPNCHGVDIGVAVSGVQAIHLLPRDEVPGSTILLQGEEKDKTFTVTGHTLVRDARSPQAELESESESTAPRDRHKQAQAAAPAEADHAVRQRAPRASWTWSPNAWRERAGQLIDWAAKHQIGELFINVPVQDGRVAQSTALADFVRQAGSRGIAVSAFEDEPQLLLPASHATAIARVRAYAAYNAEATAAQRLRRVQFDIQPGQIAAEVLPQAARDRRYLELAAALRAASGKLLLDFVVPSAWSENAALMRALARHADTLTVRNYRTDPDEIGRRAAPFLDWGLTHGKQVRIALTAGPAGAGIERRYRRAAPGARGELLMFDIDGQKVLLLLTVPTAQKSAQAWQMDRSRPIDGPATTFHADREALMRLLPQLEQTFARWQSFGGMALHGLR